MGNNAHKSFDGAIAAVAITGAQFGVEGQVADEGIERKVAVVAIVAVKVAAFLAAMNEIIGGIEIDDDFFGVLRKGLGAEFDERSLNVGVVGVDLVIVRG